LDTRLSLEGSKEPESLNVPHNSVGWLFSLSLARRLYDQPSAIPVFFIARPLMSRLALSKRTNLEERKGHHP
jgi:hypothetical protein